MTRHDDERGCDILDATQQVATIVAGGETAFRADRARVDPNQVWVIATVSVPELARLLSAR